MRATTLVKTMALVATLAGMTTAQVKYVAVVETEVDAQSGAAAKINPAEVRLMTAGIRKEAVENLPRDKYNIMTSETVIAQGGAVLEECSDENCVITLGSKIGADYIARGHISRMGTLLAVLVEMYETENGNLVASTGIVSSENVAELLEKATAACGEMYRKFVRPNGSTRSSAQMTSRDVDVVTSHTSGVTGGAGSVSLGDTKRRYAVGANFGLDIIGNNSFHGNLYFNSDMGGNRRLVIGVGLVGDATDFFGLELLFCFYEWQFNLTDDGFLSWYAGFGGAMGHYSASAPSEDDTWLGDDEGFGVGIGGQVGIEFNFAGRGPISQRGYTLGFCLRPMFYPPIVEFWPIFMLSLNINVKYNF